MQNIYELEVQAQCPVNDNDRDIYQVIITSPHIIKVEDINDFFRSKKSEKIFQEELTRQAAVALGARVETIGNHSGVIVRSIAP